MGNPDFEHLKHFFVFLHFFSIFYISEFLSLTSFRAKHHHENRSNSIRSGSMYPIRGTRRAQ